PEDPVRHHPRHGRHGGIRGPRPHQPYAVRHRRRRHHHDPRRPAAVSALHGARQPADGLLQARRAAHRAAQAGRSAGPVPARARTPAPVRRLAVRRRAADGRNRPRPDGRPEAAGVRRAVAGALAAAGAANVRHHPQRHPARRHRAAGGAERLPHAAPGRPRLRAGERRDRAARHRTGTAQRPPCEKSLPGPLTEDFRMTDTCMYIDHGQGGAPACLVPATRPVERPAGRQVLIEVAYAGVNRPDVLQRAGAYPPPPGASPYLGLEVSGRIVAVGPDARDRKVGEQVCALTPGGGYAEYCLADERHCLPVPRGLSLLEAAALPENYFTVWTNVFERARLRAGETFLVHGGSSGIGLTAIQLAQAFGAEVWTTVGTAAKADACRQAGAAHAVLYREQDFEEQIRAATGGK